MSSEAALSSRLSLASPAATPAASGNSRDPRALGGASLFQLMVARHYLGTFRLSARPSSGKVWSNAASSVVPAGTSSSSELTSCFALT